MIMWVGFLPNSFNLYFQPLGPRPIQSISRNVCVYVDKPAYCLCIVGELPGVGSVAIAVRVGDR